MSEGVNVRQTRPSDFPSIIRLCRLVYTSTTSWSEEQLSSHVDVFPEGQLVATSAAGEVLGMCASLIVTWDDYDHLDSWRDFTDRGFFRNHDPIGKTLYGAEVMVHPDSRGQGIGSRLYQARRELVERLSLRRIRAGARLRGYHDYASELTAHEYVRRVVRGEIGDPTLSFQLRHGFKVLSVVPDYLRHDPESLGYAALIEWLNPRPVSSSHPVSRPAEFSNG